MMMRRGVGEVLGLVRLAQMRRPGAVLARGGVRLHGTQGSGPGPRQEASGGGGGAEDVMGRREARAWTEQSRRLREEVLAEQEKERAAAATGQSEAVQVDHHEAGLRAAEEEGAVGPGMDDIEEEDLEEMFVEGPAGLEWNGPTRGGKYKEPTRFGDWEKNGRCSDF